MIQVSGRAGGTSLTGTLYEQHDSVPLIPGAPDDGAPFVWLCDAFYEVESGGAVQAVDDREIRVAFERPVPRGFERRERALAAAQEHIRTQFVRIGVDGDSVDLDTSPETSDE